jgi:hypothetical protein
MQSPDVQPMLHAEQCCGSCARSTQRPLQQRPVTTWYAFAPTPTPNAHESPVAPAAHVTGRQRLPSQKVPLGHGAPPQALPGQPPSGSRQLPRAQIWPATHWAPHAPQCCALVVRLTHAPAQQVPRPPPGTGQVMPEFASVHVGVATHPPPLQNWPAPHARPHCPQFPGSE